MTIDISPKDVLIVVDMQYDFLPGGSLAVTGGDEIVPLINTLAKRFTNVVLTQDWHPADHISFASQHAGKNPVRNHRAALWHPGALARPLRLGHARRRDLRRSRYPHAQMIIRKGYNRLIDSYSGFQEADRETLTGLAGYLNERDLGRSMSLDWPPISASAGPPWMPRPAASTSP